MLTREHDILTLTKIWPKQFLSTENRSINVGKRVHVDKRSPK